jgi:rare lipoprotein A (peptidoglycan hydrolase)
VKRLLALVALVLAFVFPATSSASVARASWYGPGLYGNHLACGGRLTPGTIGVAHKWLRCGTRLTICFRGRCARASVVDRGPYVYGREFDLTAGLAWRLRFSGVQTISWRYGW